MNESRHTYEWGTCRITESSCTSVWLSHHICGTYYWVVTYSTHIWVCNWSIRMRHVITYVCATECTSHMTHCNTLQHTATHCNTLQHTATHCNTLLHTATHCYTLQHICVCNWVHITYVCVSEWYECGTPSHMSVQLSHHIWVCNWVIWMRHVAHITELYVYVCVCVCVCMCMCVYVYVGVNASSHMCV